MTIIIKRSPVYEDSPTLETTAVNEIYTLWKVYWPIGSKSEFDNFL